MDAPDHPGLEWAPVHHQLQGPSYWDIWRYRLMTTAGLVIACAALWDASCGGAHRAPWQDLSLAGPTVSVILSTLEAPRYPRVAPGPSESGEGHVQGTDSIDPALRQEALAHRLPGPPGDLGAEGTAAGGEGGRVLPDLDLSLPLAPGGTGWRKGSGHDATRGGLKAGPAYDLQLVVLHREPAISDLPWDDPDLRIPVQLLLTIGGDGVPLHARPYSGPQRLFPDCIRAALKWRFEPLAQHGLEIPLHIRLTFHPQPRR